VESRLRGQGAELAHRGAFAHPEEIPQSGDVPDEPGWRYYFHGRGCCFTQSDGTTVDVDFADDGTALDIDAYFYTGFLRSTREADWCEQQLKQTEGFENAWQFDLARLADAGLIKREWRFRLTDSGRQLAECIEPLMELLQNSEPPIRCWLLCLLGDLQNAGNVASTAGLSVDLSQARRRQTERRACALKSALRSADESHARFALVALGLTGPEHSFADMEVAVSRRPATGMNHDALAVLKQWNGEAVVDCLVATLRAMTEQSVGEKVRAWFQRNTSKEPERARLGLIVGIAEELMRRFQPSDIPRELRRLLTTALSGDCFAVDDDAGFLLYLLDAKSGRRKLRGSLASRVPMTRQGAACFLAMIGDGECIKILVGASNGSPEQGGHEAACALSLMVDERALRAAQEWARRNDGYEEAEGKETELMGRTIRTWSMDEMMRVQMRETMRHWHEQTNQRSAPLLKRWRPASTAVA
jgi:hypothetical protein